MITRYAGAVLGAGLLLAACGGDARSATVFKITAITDQTRDELREKNKAMSDWLGRQLGVDVEFVPVTNYSAAVTAVVSGQADMAWLGGVTTVQAMQQSDGACVPIMTRASDLRFKSYFIVPKDSPARSIADLKGKSFTFGSKSSTSGHVMPRYFLGAEYGVPSPEEFFASVAYSGNHPNTIRDVGTGVADAGALNYKTYDDPPPELAAAKENTRILVTTPEYVDYSWTARNDIDDRFGAGTTAKVKQAFLGLSKDDPEQAALLDAMRAEKYVEAKPELWDGIKTVLASTDIK